LSSEFAESMKESFFKNLLYDRFGEKIKKDILDFLIKAEQTGRIHK
jgi:hypothetical protein